MDSTLNLAIFPPLPLIRTVPWRNTCKDLNMALENAYHTFLCRLGTRGDPDTNMFLIHMEVLWGEHGNNFAPPLATLLRNCQ